MEHARVNDDSGCARKVRWGVAALTAVVIVAGFIPFALRAGSEVDVYVVGGVRMRTGDEIYRLDERAFAYPPLLGVPGIPLSFMPQLAYAFVWYLSVCATLIAVMHIVMRRVSDAVSDGTKQSQRWFWGLTLLLAARHLAAPFENQSHDLLIFLCVLWSLVAWMRSADVKAGFWAGTAAALKATPLLLLPFFLWQRKWRAATALLVAGVVLTLATDLFWPRNDGGLWIVAWYKTFLNRAAPGDLANMPNWDPWCALNQSLSGTLRRWLMPLPDARPLHDDRIDVAFLALSPNALRVVTLGGLGAIFGWMLYVSRTSVTEGLSARRRKFLQLGQGGVLVTAMVLLSPTSIKTHFGVLVLPIAVCVADCIWHRRDRVTIGLLAVSFFVGTLTTKSMIGHQLGQVVMTAGSVTIVAVAVLIATGRVVLIRSREWQAEVKTYTTTGREYRVLRRAA